jgi:hypothetical protein
VSDGQNDGQGGLYLEGGLPVRSRVTFVASKVTKTAIPRMPPKGRTCALRSLRGRAHGISLCRSPGLGSCLRRYAPTLLTPVLGDIQGGAQKAFSIPQAITVNRIAASCVVSTRSRRSINAVEGIDFLFRRVYALTVLWLRGQAPDGAQVVRRLAESAGVSREAYLGLTSPHTFLLSPRALRIKHVNVGGTFP